MSHSKETKRNYSRYVEAIHPSAKKYIHTCRICGYTGYNPVIEAEDFLELDRQNGPIRRELTKILPRLPLDAQGRCPQCARAMDGEG